MATTATLLVRTKILIVCQHFWPESFRINDIAEYLVEHNHDVDVLCGIPNYPSGKFTKGYGYFKNRKQTFKNIRIRRVFEIPRSNNSNIRIFLNYISFPVASLFHIPNLINTRYDKIFLYQTSPVMMTISGIILGKIKKIETTMYVLDLWPENLYSVLPIRNRILRYIVKSVSYWHYRSVNKLVVLSETMRNELVSRTGISIENITVLPQSPEKIYEQEIYDESLKKRFSKGFNLVFTGSITPAQSFDTIITTARILQDRGIHDINWIIVGDGMSRKKVEDDVRISELSDIFYFEGQKPIKDIPKYTSIADGLIGCLMKSDLLEATIPAKVMSYIASGKPLILAMDGEVQDLINKTIRGGYASDTEDAIALANNIVKLRNLPLVEREKMSSRLKDYYSKNLDRDVVLSELVSFIYR